MKICPTCSVTFGDDALFCDNDGHKLVSDPSPPSVGRLRVTVDDEGDIYTDELGTEFEHIVNSITQTSESRGLGPVDFFVSVKSSKGEEVGVWEITMPLVLVSDLMELELLLDRTRGREPKSNRKYALDTIKRIVHEARDGSLEGSFGAKFVPNSRHSSSVDPRVDTEGLRTALRSTPLPIGRHDVEHRTAIIGKVLPELSLCVKCDWVGEGGQGRNCPRCGSGIVASSGDPSVTKKILLDGVVWEPRLAVSSQDAPRFDALILYLIVDSTLDLDCVYLDRDSISALFGKLGGRYLATHRITMFTNLHMMRRRSHEVLVVSGTHVVAFKLTEGENIPPNLASKIS